MTHEEMKQKIFADDKGAEDAYNKLVEHPDKQEHTIKQKIHLFLCSSNFPLFVWAKYLPIFNDCWDKYEL